MTVKDAIDILRTPALDDAARKIHHAALVVLGVEHVDLSTIEKSIMRRLTLREEDVIYASAAWRAA
jgi:hypothetical protein